MTTLTQRTPFRLSDTLRQLFGPGDFMTLIVVVVLLTLPAFSLQAAEWPLEMGIVLPVTVLGTLLGFLLARSRFNELLALMISGMYGVGISYLAAVIATPGGGPAVIERVSAWLIDAFSGGINQDELVFTLMVTLLFWFLGYNAAWHVFRIDRVWRVILPPALIMVSNAVFYTGPNSLEIYLVALLFISLILLTRSNLDAREWEWYSNGIRVPRRLRAQFMRVGAALALIILVAAWVVPSGNLQERLDDFQDFLRSDPLREFNEFWNRLFVSIEAEGPASADYFGGDSLELGGAIRLGNQEVLQIQVPQGPRYYWRSRVFDTYEYGRWVPGAEVRLTTPNKPLDVISEPVAAREPVEQFYTILMRSSRLVYTMPQPAWVDLPTRTYLSYLGENRDTSPMNISAIRPLQVLSRGESYNARSLISTASADQLRAAGTDYPGWVVAHPQYLRTSPEVLSDRVRALADQIVAEAAAVNPYDRAKAIETWLRRNITYNETIPGPPPGLDPIDWFLFEIREGYCNYYATAMIVMLRSQGIPARMAAGFAQGDWDPARGAYIVKERDAHTWVEAYFPGYGWIEFEPTSAQAPLVREGDQVIPESVAQAQIATPTPTPTPTEIPPTPTPLPTDPANQPPPNEPTQPPSPTLTFTPSPTATPVIVPTQPPPVEPEARNPLSFILPALGAALLGLMVLLALAALFVFIYWWWEWRGMGGLSPISRAYARLERYIGLLGVRFSPNDTPEERRRRVMRDLPGAERPVTYITRTYMTERYGPVPDVVESERRSETVDKAWGETRGSILKRWLRRFRFWQRG